MADRPRVVIGADTHLDTIHIAALTETGKPLADCVGVGTGLDAAGLARKQATLARALAANAAAVQRGQPLALLETVGAPLLSSTLLLPDYDEPLTDGWTIKEVLDHEVDAVLDSGDCGVDPTTVVDLTGDEPIVARVGAGDPTPFE